jgi:hypothetical protein
MPRQTLGWLLIVLGLGGVVGGAGMFYIFSSLNAEADAAARAEARQIFHAENVEPSRRAAPLLEYGAATVAVVVGLVFLIVGFGMRATAEPSRTGKRKRRRREEGTTCAACGGVSPATAQACYQCGQRFQA